ncbi:MULTISPECIES: hypothetical protein [Pseudoxanthomonas]|jgi:hypothetical protein|uniref:hypothetical protein n=1 Tax=Pseudoxanthomonas TaxID=83618 RepID=UPI00161B2A57|nr:MULTISPECIES: hypothetical protein [Pseudoxanthomonas]MBB3275329.1 hypothetical protein [Pseudoxanthomonas sp. OG2]MBV7473581.1 hypothetical protein [Pseudoxanthomonas sp. PXM05]UBB24266.1 hypothetical protein LAG73_12890 [Pseudoxanthomonas japonensis]
MPPAVPSTPSSRWLAPIILLLGGLCFSLIWVLLALYLGRQSGWMALLAALDAAVLLRFAGVRPGGRRALVAALATVAMAVLANWFIIASQLGFVLGLLPWESALRLGLSHAWTLAQLANGTLDWACLLVSPLLAAWLAK